MQADRDRARRRRARGLVTARGAGAVPAADDPSPGTAVWRPLGAVLATVCVAVLVPAQAVAQAAAAPGAAASAPAPRTVPPAAEAGQRVDVSGSRENDADQRRKSTAAKIVIGREDIDKFGDATLGEVLRRLPGVSTPGAPGRGGPPRMRGLGGGFTQLLIDGQRVPPGFSLESLTPEQIERIEILRAPTAETGARAIAGTINIITREGFQRRLNDLRTGFGVENGEVSPGVFWTHNNHAGALTYNLSAATFVNRRRSESFGEQRDEDLGGGTLLGLQNSHTDVRERRQGLNMTGRLQWRLSDNSDMLVLMPSVFHARNENERRFTLTQTLPAGLPLYDHGSSSGDGHFTSARLMGQWRQRVGEGRLEVGGHGNLWRSVSDSRRLEFRNGSSSALRRIDDSSDTRDRTLNLTAKLTQTLGGEQSEHSVVSGMELETVRRTDTRRTLQNGLPLLADFGDNLQAGSTRLALYAQDEWALNPNWALHAGLRWEGIRTEGDLGDGTRPVNISRVATPLLHLLWKPDPKKRDQVRLSLTRSYRSPQVGQLIARPSINSRYPVAGPNEPTSPDSAGNPGLQPELASGIDLAFERYLEGGGVLSANLFVRRISDLMRNVTRLETVSWSPVQRWVSRPQNIGDATTVGIELEAKYRLDQLLADAPRVELKHNLSLYKSRVEGIPGPDNRLDSQAPATANLGADYRLRGTPLTLGGNLNWVPGYRSQTAVDRASRVGSKLVADVFGLWTFSPSVGLRLLANNLAPRDYESSTEFVGATQRETSRSGGPSYTNWQLRLELKL